MQRRPGRSAKSLADSPRWLYAAAGQLRAPWRLLLFATCLFFAQGIAESFISPAFGMLSAAIGEPIPSYPWTMLAAVFAAVVVALRNIDDAPWSAVALGDGAWHVRLLLLGGGLGAAAIVGTTVLLWTVGALRFETSALVDGSVSTLNAWSGTSLRLLLLLAPAALWEELIFRGYLWHVAVDGVGVAFARWSTSLAFTAVHLMNPGASIRSTIVVFLAGMCLARVRERSASLPAAWGAHLAWNWVMAAALHVPVSGLAFATPGYRAVLSGPDWLTGGAWGPEGSAIAGLVLIAAMVWSEWPRRREYFPKYFSTRTDHARKANVATRTSLMRSPPAQ